MGIGDWGLGIGEWAQSPIPNPQSPIPNPHNIHFFIIINYININNYKVFFYCKFINYIIIIIKNGRYSNNS